MSLNLLFQEEILKSDGENGGSFEFEFEGVGIDFAFEEGNQSLLVEDVLICCLRDVDNGRSWII